MTSNDASSMRQKFTVETGNLAISSIQDAVPDLKLDFTTEGPFWDILRQEGIMLAVSREYEHFITMLGGNGGAEWQTALSLPHPSGLFYDPAENELVVSSTRTPNQIFFMKPLSPEDMAASEILPPGFQVPDGTVFIPYKSILLPGTLYIHDVVAAGGDIYATITGHNFLARIDRQGNWRRVWSPACVDSLGDAAFNQNYVQLNSVALPGTDPAAGFYTGFSDQTTGPKPWKDGYGPKGKGVVYAGDSRQVICRDLTCPHSAKLHDGKLWICNSGYGSVGPVDGFRDGAGIYRPVVQTTGFTRGLAFKGRFGFVGLSKVIDFYEPYAPGLKPADSRCGIIVFDTQTGQHLASLTWPDGYQIYDVQVLPEFHRPLLPNDKGADGVNPLLRFVG